MDSILYEKIVDAIKSSINHSNPFMKSNILIKRVSIIIFISSGFTLLNYLILKNVIKKQIEMNDNLKKIENTIICKTFNTLINRDVYKHKISRGTSTLDLLSDDNIDNNIAKNDSEYDLLDKCYNVKKNIYK